MLGPAPIAPPPVVRREAVVIPPASRRFPGRTRSLSRLALSAKDITRSGGPAEPYAEALFALAKDRKATDAVEKDLEGLRDLARSNEEVSRLLRAPGLKRDERAKAIDALLAKAGAHDLTRNAAGVAAKRNRAFLLPAIADAFARRAAKARGEIRARVTTAHKLTAAQEKSVKAALKAAVGQDPILDLEVDESLLGGLKVRIGSKLIDASLKARLDAMNMMMKGAS